ncbi:MAG: monophosphatase [Candidatus Binatota bacterium]|nr:monophosphatase [Candidatus Binatota bacterium]
MDAHESAARAAAERAAGIVRERWHGRKDVTTKSTAIDLVTETDRACEDAIVGALKQAFPAYAVLGEESGAQGQGPYRWIVDPIDGTTNFAHTYPQVAISIGLVHQSERIFGLVLDPLRAETFTAHRGEGAFLNGEPITVSKTGELGGSLLATGFPYDRRERADFYLAYFRAFMLRTQGLRRAGSAALDLCWVAAGRVDGFWEWKLHPWDVAAGSLIVEEAGGRTSDFEGNLFDAFGDQMLATNGSLHEPMLEVLREVGRAASAA